MPKATFFESAICGKRTVNCYSATRLTVAPNKRFYMLANKRARITGWQLRLLLYKGRRGCCIFLTQYSSGSNEKVSQRSEICLKSLLVGLHLERCSSRVWNPRISIFKLSLIPKARTPAFYLRRNCFWRKNEFWKANSTLSSTLKRRAKGKYHWKPWNFPEGSTVVMLLGNLERRRIRSRWLMFCLQQPLITTVIWTVLASKS